MDKELQKWYKALEEADKRAEAGDEQARNDAFEIADTIRKLEEQSTPVEPADLADPLFYGGMGAIPATVKAGANLFRAEVPPPGRTVAPTTTPAAPAATSPLAGVDIDRQIEGTPGPGGTGRSRMGFNTITQQRAELGQQAKENIRALQQKGIIDSPKIPQAAASTRSGILLTQGGLEQIENAPPPPKPTVGQRLTQSIKGAPAAAAQSAKAAPGAVVRGVANLPLRATAGGFAGGALAADAYNYRELAREAEALGDTKAAAYYNSMAAASGLGSGAGFAGSFAPSYKPKTRAMAVPAAGLAIYNYLQSQKGYPGPGQDVGQAPPESKVKSVMQGYAKGRAVKSGLDALKKFDLGNLEGKTIIGTMSDRTAVDLPRGLHGGPLFPTIHKGAAWAVDAPGAASRLINAVQAAGGPEKTVVAPMLMSPGAHRSNRDVAKLALKRFQENYNAGQFSPERLAEIEQAVRKVPGLAEHPGLMDPNAINMFDKMTFGQRGSTVDWMGSKPKKAPALDLDALLRETTEKGLEGTELGAIGPSLFRLSGERSVDPSLHGSYSHILHGEMLGGMNPIPREFVFRDLEAKAMKELGRPLSDYNYRTSVGIPSQFVDDKLLRSWEELGFMKPKTGGLNNPE